MFGWTPRGSNPFTLLTFKATDGFLRDVSREPLAPLGCAIELAPSTVQFQVADAGSLGGGMSSCFLALTSRDCSADGGLAFLEAVLRHPRLSLRRRELLDDGASGSSLEDAVWADGESLIDFEAVRGLGPIGFPAGVAAGVSTSRCPRVYSSGNLALLLKFTLGLGRDPEVKGVMACRVLGSGDGKGTPLSDSSN